MNDSIPVIEMVDSKNHSLQFELQTMEYIDEHRHNRIDHPHKHDYFVIIWMKSAEGKHMVDFQEFVVDQPAIFSSCPRINCRYPENVSPALFLKYLLK